MKKFYHTLLPVFLTSFIFLNFAPGTAQNTSSNEAVRTEIEEAYKDFAQNMKEGNAEGIAAHYTDDAKFYPPNGGLATGKQEITQVFNGFIEQGLNIELEIEELEIFGDVAYEYGVATVMNQQGNELAQNEYVVLWKKNGDKWKIHRDFIRDKIPE